STNAGTLTVNTGGNATITNSSAIILGASTVGGQLQVSANGSLTTSDVVSANILQFSTATGSDGDISFGANATGTTSATITANGHGTITGGTLGGGLVTLTSDTGNIDLATNASSIAASTGGNLTIANASGLNLGAMTAGGQLQVSAAG